VRVVPCPHPSPQDTGRHMPTFIIDCPRGKAKVGAELKDHIDRSYFDNDAREPNGERILIGKPPFLSVSSFSKMQLTKNAPNCFHGLRPNS
jgi:hypothetical protein